MADPALRALSRSAAERQTFALAAISGKHVVYTMAKDATASELQRVITAAVGLQAERRVWASLADTTQAHERLLPLFRAALAEQELIIARGTEEPDAKHRSPENLLWRARQLLYVNAVTDALERGSGPTQTSAALREAVSRGHVDIAGYARDAKPPPSNYAGLAANCGWAPITKQQSSWPFMRSEPVPGHMQMVNVNGLMRALEGARGEDLADDDPIWTVLEHLHAHHPAFITPTAADLKPSEVHLAGISFQARVAQSSGPLRLGKAVRLEGPLDTAVIAQLEENARLGITRELTPEEIADKSVCAVIAPVRPVIKGKIVPSAEAAAALLREDPTAATAVAAAAAQQADQLVAAVAEKLRAMTPDEVQSSPHAALDQVLADAKGHGSIKVRACVNGHDLSTYIHDASFSYLSLDEILAACTPGATIGKTDGQAFFYVVPYAAAAKRYLCIEYAGRVWVQERLSMGLCDSPALASALSAILCEIVAGRTGAFVRAYLDDILNVSPTGGEHGKVVQDAILQAMADANIPESTHKRALGECIPVLGRVIDTVRGTVSLPRPTMYAYLLHIAIVRRLLSSDDPAIRSTVTTANISSLSGKLGWWARSLLRARTKLGGVIKAATSGASVAALRAPIIADLHWWEFTFATGKLAAEVTIHPTTDTAIIRLSGGGADDPRAESHIPAAKRRSHLASDAGDHGGGAIFGDQAIHLTWTPYEAQQPSDHREARMTLEAVRTWAHLWSTDGTAQPRQVLLLMDNLGNVFNINCGRARRPEVMHIISQIYDVAESNNIVFIAAWLPREANLAADALSKCKSTQEAAQVASKLGLCLLPSHEPAARHASSL